MKKLFCVFGSVGIALARDEKRSIGEMYDELTKKHGIPLISPLGTIILHEEI